MKTRKKADAPAAAKRRLPIRPIPVKITASPEEAEKSRNSLANQGQLRISADSALSPTHNRSSNYIINQRALVSPGDLIGISRKAFTTPPRTSRAGTFLGARFRVSPDSGLKRPKTPTKRRKALPIVALESVTILNAEPLSAENSVEPAPIIVNEIYQHKLTSSKARRCLFPSDKATFKQNHDVFVRSVDDRQRNFLDKKTKKWAYDFQKDEPLQKMPSVSATGDTRSPSPIWTKALDAPKFYRTRGYVSRTTRNNNKSSSPSVMEVSPEKLAVEETTPKTTPVKRHAEKKSSETSSAKKKRSTKTTPQKQTKITDMYSPRKVCKSISPGMKLTSSSTAPKNKGKKKLKL